MERLSLEDALAPHTQTSSSLRGGAPPIPPHNRPPVATAVGTPDPEPNPDDIRGIVECASEEEAQATIRQMGYYVTKIGVGRPTERHARSERTQTTWETTMATIQGLYWSARDQIVEVLDAYNEGYRMAHAPKKHPKVLS